jgi:hypothetical protein
MVSPSLLTSRSGIALVLALIFCSTTTYYSFSYEKVATKTKSNLQSLLATPTTMSAIDSHVHVWTDGSIPFVYSGDVHNDFTVVLHFMWIACQLRIFICLLLDAYNIYLYILIHTYLYIHVCTYVYVYICICMYVHIYTYIYLYIYIYANRRICICMYIYMHTYVCIYLYLYMLCIYAYTCILTYVLYTYSQFKLFVHIHGMYTFILIYSYTFIWTHAYLSIYYIWCIH